LLFPEVRVNIADGDDRVHVDAKILPNLHHGGFAGILADFATVHRDEHIRHGNLCTARQDRDHLADCSSGCDDVLNNEDAVSVDGFVAHKTTAFAVIFGFLAVEEERFVDSVVARQGTGGRGHKRDSFVCGAEQSLKPVTADTADQRGIKVTQL